jgi:hypothetical protein
VGIRHDDVADAAGTLGTMALNSSLVSYEPLIFYGTGVTAGGETEVPASPTKGRKGKTSKGGHVAGDDVRGDIAIHGLWKRGETSIIDVRITDSDTPSYASSTSAQVLERAAKAKKNKYLEACIERRRSFTPLVYSIDGMACREAKAFEKRVASLLASKHDRPYSEMVGYVKGRMSIAVVRANTMMLRGSRTGGARAMPRVDNGAAFDAIGRMRGW